MQADASRHSMSKIELTMTFILPVLAGISPANDTAAPGDGISPLSDFRASQYSARSLAAQEPATLDRAPARLIIWHSEPGDRSPFGFIPTRWTAEPELLPMRWDAETVFAGYPDRRLHVAGQSRP